MAHSSTPWGCPVFSPNVGTRYLRERKNGSWRPISCGGFSVWIYSANALRHMSTIARMPQSLNRTGIGERQVLNRFAKTFVSVTVGAAMGASLALAQTPAKEKQVQDQ